MSAHEVCAYMHSCLPAFLCIYMYMSSSVCPFCTLSIYLYDFTFSPGLPFFHIIEDWWIIYSLYSVTAGQSSGLSTLLLLALCNLQSSGVATHLLFALCNSQTELRTCNSSGRSWQRCGSGLARKRRWSTPPKTPSPTQSHLTPARSCPPSPRPPSRPPLSAWRAAPTSTTRCGLMLACPWNSVCMLPHPSIYAP